MALIYNAGTWGTEAEESENSKYTEGSECMGRDTMAVYPLHLHLLRVQHQESRTTPAKVNWAPLDEGSVSIKSSLSERLGFKRNQRQRHSRGPTGKKSQSSGQEYWTWKSDFFHPSFSNGFRSSL